MVSQSFTCVSLWRNHGGLRLGSQKGWRRPDVCLSTKTTCWARARCPFVEPVALIDRDSSSMWARRALALIEFFPHCMSEWMGIERKKDILTSFKRPKWPIRPKKWMHKERKSTHSQMLGRLYEEERCMGMPETHNEGELFIFIFFIFAVREFVVVGSCLHLRFVCLCSVVVFNVRGFVVWCSDLLSSREHLLFVLCPLTLVELVAN